MSRGGGSDGSDLDLGSSDERLPVPDLLQRVLDGSDAEGAAPATGGRGPRTLTPPRTRPRGPAPSTDFLLPGASATLSPPLAAPAQLPSVRGVVSARGQRPAAEARGAGPASSSTARGSRRSSSALPSVVVAEGAVAPLTLALPAAHASSPARSGGTSGREAWGHAAPVAPQSARQASEQCVRALLGALSLLSKTTPRGPAAVQAQGGRGVAASSSPRPTARAPPAALQPLARSARSLPPSTSAAWGEVSHTARTWHKTRGRLRYLVPVQAGAATARWCACAATTWFDVW